MCCGQIRRSTRQRNCLLQFCLKLPDSLLLRCVFAYFSYFVLLLFLVPIAFICIEWTLVPTQCAFGLIDQSLNWIIMGFLSIGGIYSGCSGESNCLYSYSFWLFIYIFNKVKPNVPLWIRKNKRARVTRAPTVWNRTDINYHHPLIWGALPLPLPRLVPLPRPSHPQMPTHHFF